MGGGRGDSGRHPTRREALRAGLGAAASLAARPAVGMTSLTDASVRDTRSIGAARQQAAMIRRPIPSSGESIPVVGLGTWQTFDVGGEAAERSSLRSVLRSFASLGGTVVDSSPMYGTSQAVLGDLAGETGLLGELWVATKVWIRGQEEGIAQMEQSMAELRSPQIQLMQVHNLVDVAAHLDTLEAWKAEGRIRYVGITTSSARQYAEMEDLLDDDRLDFIQVNYSLAERSSAERVLPKAAERGVAVMVNRPFAGGRLFRELGRQPLPDWADEIEATAWSQIFLKYILSHPAVTVAIPATSDPEHLRENMGGGIGSLPSEELRGRMERLLDG